MIANKINVLQSLLWEQEVGAALLTFLPDVRWACGFTGSSAVLLVRPDQAHFVTDGRYRTQAEHEVQGATVHVPGYNLLEHVAEEHLFGPAQTVLLQAEHVTLAERDRLGELFPELTWKPVAQWLTRTVASKEPGEVDRMRRAQRITDAVFAHLLEMLRPGMTEREVAAEIVYQHLQRGAERVAFEPIVASGPQGALPHARPSDKKIRQGELVVLDFGAFVDGYASDMTRTVAVGDPGEEARAVYQTVLGAQERALEAARAGLPAKALDAVAREVIKEAGYGEFFGHGLGHGVGLQVHEWPRVSYHAADDEVLPEGAAITIEPGIYLPDRFGVRIEDLIVLRADGADNLTASPKTLTVL